MVGRFHLDYVKTKAHRSGRPLQCVQLNRPALGSQLREELGLTGIIMESNVGGQIPVDCVLNSIRLFAQEVAPRLRAGS
jgi:hypothetical protein